jgi:nucleoside-diphosphate-sugar epimerase
MKILITGAGGFLGSAIARRAVATGDEVVAVARGEAPPRLATTVGSLRRVQAEMADQSILRRVLSEERPDIVVHCAWAGLAPEARGKRWQVENNLVASYLFAEAAADAGVHKFIGIGSQAEYGLLNRRITEHDLPQPVSLYGAAKLAVFHLIGQIGRDRGMDVAWLRLFAAYGPGDNPNWLIPNLIRQMLEGRRPETTMGTQKWDYLYIDDAARGVLAAAKSHGAVGAMNLSSDTAVPVRQIAERLRDLAAPQMELVFGEVPFGPNQIMHLQGSNEKLHSLTGWAPRVPLEEGLTRTVDSMRSKAQAAGFSPPRS